ncbi:hypothetical protein [Brevibacillus brevis]|uniref:DUF5067 domain-containing protein n=1 Tax=Brevibacillus brevis TaxID=1393 RepID=A0ABY9T024_BREBE|nr:hypothetical protein [Brevibacillus brevis]WNC13187.1 hypothetical protein RGB73_21055 [Brevibacillus brevis]
MNKRKMICIVSALVCGLGGCSPASEGDGTNKPNPHVAREANQQTEETNRGDRSSKIAAYLEEECKKAFSSYYVLVDFEMSDYREQSVDGKVEATFAYKVTYQNKEKDPDTVGYIKAAKETGDPHYQQLYDEYGMPKEMNFDLKAVLDETDDIALYTNVSPKGKKWEKVVMSDFILKE